MDWQMKVTCGEKEQVLENLLKENVEKVVDEAFKKGKPADYEIPTDGLEEAAAAQAAALAGAWNVKAKNGSISAFLMRPAGSLPLPKVRTGRPLMKRS